MSWYLGVLRKYAVFHGRARRKEYWLFFLGNFIVSSILVAIDSRLERAGIERRADLAYLYSLAVILPSIGVSIRRLHDTDRRGWWLLLFLIPVVGAIVLIVFYVQDGTVGENRFGPDPKAIPPVVEETRKAA
jgi:uncharacterized membrane protein YhaH (DUF805 family)